MNRIVLMLSLIFSIQKFVFPINDSMPENYWISPAIDTGTILHTTPQIESRKWVTKTE